MFKIIWDKSTGGVLLSSQVFKETLGYSPRPVFFEELDLLGIDKLGWEYPRCPEPIMWAINKQYWYRGDLLFDAKGANIYDTPTIIIAKGIKPSVLNAIDVQTMLEKNADKLFLIESEAVEFIRDVYTTYSKVNQAHNTIQANHDIDFEALAEKIEKKSKKKMAVVKEDCDSFDVVPLDIAKKTGKQVLLSTKIDRFIASFSGGKDSQVVLDLCTKAIPPTEFEVIYSDTGYELPPSLLLYEEVQLYYHKRFPTLKFSTTRNHESVLNYWDKIGTPSDTHRWCCSVMKTAPLYRSLKVEGNKQARVLAFEGVRSEESVRRGSYNRIGKGVKHSFVINARPIFEWSTTEIFLYLFNYKLPINVAYRLGKPRVGCILCPFGSPWDDMIVNRCYSQYLAPFLEKVEKIVKERKIPNYEEYIKERKWKLRASGTNVKNKTSVKIDSTSSHFVAILNFSSKNILVWLPILGDFIYCVLNNAISGTIKFEKNTFPFSIDQRKHNEYLFKVSDGNNIRLRYYLRRIVYKSAYCINCEACEIECPTGALSVYPQISINKTKCVHCLKCIDFHQHGCIVADSLITTTMEGINKTTKISIYGTFGIQDGWVDEFLSNPSTFWETNSLGTKQVYSFKSWLKDAELIDEKGNLTSLGFFCYKNKDDYTSLIWEIIHINLCYNNPLMKWFITKIEYGKILTRKELEVSILEYFSKASKPTTISYSLVALLQVFKYSPIGTEFEIFVSTDSKNTSYIRKKFEGLSLEAVAYSIYKYAKTKGISIMRVSDFYRQEETTGLFREFGISANELLKKLRSLSLDSNQVLIAELNMGLDHITLREDLNAISVLELLTK